MDCQIGAKVQHSAHALENILLSVA